MKTYPISEKLCLDLRGYLATRPWGEVNHLIVGITQQIIAAEERIAAEQKAAEEQGRAIEAPAKANGKAEAERKQIA